MKLLTLSAAETKRWQAIDFLRRIGKDDEADEFEAMTPEDYAEHRGAEIIDNPIERRSESMARNKTKEQLQAELDEANEYIEELEAKLDDIAGIATEEDEEGDADEDASADDDEEDDDGRD